MGEEYVDFGECLSDTQLQASGLQKSLSGCRNGTSLNPLQFLHYSVSANIVQKDLLDELQTVRGSFWVLKSCANDFFFFF